MDERQIRQRRNEGLFRAVNEQIEELDAAFAAVADDGFAVICECGQMACAEQILIATVEYARVRTDPTLFILVPGHEDAAIEAVVEDDQGGYVVVKKLP